MTDVHLHRYRLFARPSFVEGVARILDFSNALNSYNYARSDNEADALGLSEDWRAVGDDLRAAIDSLSREDFSLASLDEE